MLKKTAIALSLICLPLTASAQWLAGTGYVHFSEDFGRDDLSLAAVYGSLAYKIDNSGHPFTFMPELRLGTGVSDDRAYGVKVEINRYIAISARGQYDYSNGVFVFVTPSYANLDLDFTNGDYSGSEDDWEFGIGAGVGYALNEKITLEASYDRFDDTDAFGVGIKYAF